MNPVIGVSVARINPSRWIMGSLMVCEKVDRPEAKPADAIVHWQDGDSIFYLRKRSADDSELSAGDVDADKVHAAGTSTAVWLIGNTFVKLHAWIEGRELEADVMRFVAEKAPEVPIPELVHTWIDHDLDRSFLITKRVEGQILDKVWLNLSPLQRTQIADDVARFCVALAAHTSPRYETVTRGAVFNEPWLNESAPQSHPTWKPRFLGPLSQEAMQAFLTKISTEPPPDIDTEFHFYHADLGPTNIMVSEDGRLSAIIDWESAAYYPRFWLATKPLITNAFCFDCKTDDPGLWAKLLVQRLGGLAAALTG